MPGGARAGAGAGRPNVRSGARAGEGAGRPRTRHTRRAGRVRPRAWLLLPAAVLLLLLLGIGGVVLGQSADISLNSPVSFPVDI